MWLYSFIWSSILEKKYSILQSNYKKKNNGSKKMVNALSKAQQIQLDNDKFDSDSLLL
jgi:hypothetical protein